MGLSLLAEENDKLVALKLAFVYISSSSSGSCTWYPGSMTEILFYHKERGEVGNLFIKCMVPMCRITAVTAGDPQWSF